MLTRAQVQRYSNESGLRDIMIAEKEVVLTFLLQLLSERGILDRLAFKGGTCLRKKFVGNQGRFSTDLDFTGIEEHDHEDIILDMMAAFEQVYHGIQFAIPDEGYYETQDGLSWGVNPTYSRNWNQGGSEIKLQISRREIPTLPTERLAQIERSYSKFLPFAPSEYFRSHSLRHARIRKPLAKPLEKQRAHLHFGRLIVRVEIPKHAGNLLPGCHGYLAISFSRFLDANRRTFTKLGGLRLEAQSERAQLRQERQPDMTHRQSLLPDKRVGRRPYPFRFLSSPRCHSVRQPLCSFASPYSHLGRLTLPSFVSRCVRAECCG
jgi:hypothetical protein